MNGDKQPRDSERPPVGTPRSVQIVDSQGGRINDDPAYQGMLREQIDYVASGADGWASGVINTPAGRQTASSGPLKAWMTYQQTVRQRMKLSTGSTRWTSTVTKVNDDNMPVEVDDQGDESTTADDRCTRMEYLDHRSKWILDRIKRTEVVAVKCASSPQRPRDVLGDTRTTYDDGTPSRGLATQVDELGSWDGSTPTFVTTRHARYDALGRAIEQKDALNRTTTTSFTPATTGPVTEIRVINPLHQTMTTTLDPALAVPTRTVDANGASTQMTYDGSGGCWPSGRRGGPNQNPNVTYAYTLNNRAPSAVTTRTMVPAGVVDTRYRTSVSLYDGLLRLRQVQTQSGAGGRTLADSVYDSRGLLQWTSKPYYDTDNTAPNTTLVTPVERPEVPTITENAYDGMGRLTVASLRLNGDLKWRTTTAYAGEKTNVTPPAGGTATTTIVDARGRVSELRQYKTPSAVGSDTPSTFDRTTYQYTPRDELAQVIDPGTNAWSYRYDLRGNKVQSDDPDKGRSTSTFDAVGQLQTTTDARGATLAYTYDDLGRKTSVRRGSLTGPMLTEWTYDTRPNGLGKPATSVRYEYDNQGRATPWISSVTGYDTGGRATGSSLTVPSSQSDLCASNATDPCIYTQSLVYLPSGAVQDVLLPAAGDLPWENLRTQYTGEIGLPTSLTGAGRIGRRPFQQFYVQDIIYNQLDQRIGDVLGDVGVVDAVRVGRTYLYDEPTGRLTNFFSTRANVGDIFNLAYTYDDAGNLTSLAETPVSGQTQEMQCFKYDYLARLTDAWTPTSLKCADAPSASALAGPAPYWRSYAYDTSGNRKTETVHASTNTTHTYTYPTPGGAAGTRPHAVSQVVTAGGSPAATRRYQYDAAGNTTCRPQGTATNTCPSGGGDTQGQVLGWDDEDHLAKLTDRTGDTTFLYDADGNRLLRRDPAGKTLYLPGGQELRKPTNGAATGTRYYSFGGEVIGSRAGAGPVSWMLNDHHGTGAVTVTQTATPQIYRQHSLPFGDRRGAAPAGWAGDKGFVGGTKDNTGLTHLGAREYDPNLGRFTSVDPIMDLGQPNQWNGYSYANDNPTTLSDPDGLEPRPWHNPNYLKERNCAGNDGWECNPTQPERIPATQSMNREKPAPLAWGNSDKNSDGFVSRAEARQNHLGGYYAAFNNSSGCGAFLKCVGGLAISAGVFAECPPG